MRTTACVLLSLAMVACVTETSAATGVVSGELKRWHKVTITFDGPVTSETATPNPFRDYRLNVTFSRNGRNIVVPGYYAADGNAGNTGAEAGGKWRVHFTPDDTGLWNYAASFRQGADLFLTTDPTAGTAVGFNGAAGSFTIAASDKTGRDHRGKGLLKHVGEHYLRFSNGEWFIKVGPNSPEGFLANPDFDGSTSGTRATFSSHGQHWTPGDPTWKTDKGRNVIGAINYISSKGMNCFFLPLYTGHGDTKSVWPYRSVDDRYRFDCSKLDQWEVAFEHMDRKGLLLHLVLSETENEAYWEVMDGEANFARSRKLYYRELVARFSHHLALTWNLGEENGWSDAKGGTFGVANDTTQRKAFCDYIRALDPYSHPIVAHNLPGHENSFYTPLLNHPSFEGTSLQMLYNNFSMRWTNDRVREWIDKSRIAGKKWYVSIDEPGHENFERSSQYGDDTAGVRPDALDAAHNDPRQWSLWGALLGGAGGYETYFGWAYAPWGGGDGAVTNYAAWDGWWNQCRHAHQFFIQHLPFTEMKHDNGLTDTSTDYVFAKRDEIYAVYLRNGGTANLDLAHASGSFEVKWYDPRNGGSLQTGTVSAISGGASRGLGQAPSNADADWVCLVRRNNTTPAYTLTVVNGSGGGAYTAGTTVALAATAPPAGQIFDRWTGATVANATAATTTLRMPANNITVTATYRNRPPVITSNANATPNPTLIHQPVVLTVGASDPGGGTLSCVWNFGDGTTASGATVTKTYAAAGTYLARVTVNGAGGAATSEVQIGVVTPAGVRINFQPAGVPVPSGSLADTGAIFGNRGNGRSYGWNADNSSTARDRNAAASPDQRFDTLLHLQKPSLPDAVWEMAVANGTYIVRVVCGDPSYFDSVYKLNVEGVLAVDSTPTATQRWFDRTVSISVDDGRLTIRSVAGSVNNKLCFVELTQSPAPSAVVAAEEYNASAEATAVSAPAFGALTVLQLSLKANYAREYQDAAAAKVLLPLDALANAAGVRIHADIGGASAEFITDSKGAATSAHGACRLKRTKDGWLLQVKLAKGNWAAIWLDAGVTGDAKSTPIEFPLSITVNEKTYAGARTGKLQSVAAKGGGMR